MASEQLTVEIYVATIAHAAEIEYFPLAGLRIGIEMASIPNCAFVILQFRGLRIPVARHFEAQSAVERVFVESCLVAIGHACIVKHLFACALVILVYHHIPAAVERIGCAAICVGDRGHHGRGRSHE